MDIQALLTIGLIAMLTGGMVKGTFGIGLPLVAVPQLTFAFSLPVSSGLLVAPTIITNLWQSFDGGRDAVIARLRRFGPMSVTLVITLVIGARILVLVPEKFLYALIGVSIIAFSTITHFRPSFRISEQQHRWMGPLAGAFAGLLGGMTSFYGPPLLIYLAGLRLGKDEFVGVISLIYFVGAFGFGLGLASAGVADLELLTYSVLACIPTFIGIWLGQHVRTRLTERSYANWLYVFYLIIGSSFLIRAV
jgi:uncharacterized membrane protein YfcA